MEKDKVEYEFQVKNKYPFSSSTYEEWTTVSESLYVGLVGVERRKYKKQIK